jgi:CelD/BcsL family acetyltransferase involved in cellulose biosynthesis
MRIELITSNDELQRLADTWRRLAGESVFASPDWLIPWWLHLGSRPKPDGRTPRLATLAVRDESGELVAIAPWYLEESRIHGRAVRLMGSGRACTDFLTIPCRLGREAEVASAIADWLCDNQRRMDFGWELLALEAIDLQDPMYSRLLAELERRDAISSFRPAGNCWRVALTGTWEDYLATLSKTNRKRARRLDRSYLQTGRARMIMTTNEQDLPAAFDLLVQLHTKRWQSRGEGGIFAEPGVVEFHRDAMSRLLAADQLRLASLEIDGRPAASEYCIGGGNTLYSYQSGLDPEMISHEPGAILVVATIQDLFQHGAAGIDFLRGDEPYKLDWRAVARPLHDVRVLPGGWNGRLRQSLWQAATSAKDLLRAGRDAVLSGK